MGKTIMISSLIHSNLTLSPSELAETNEDEHIEVGKERQLTLEKSMMRKRRPRRTAEEDDDIVLLDNVSNPKILDSPTATLIIAPTTLLSQWHAEISRSSKKDSRIKPLVYYGNQRSGLEADVS